MVTSFHEIYLRYSQDVYRFAFWLCGDSDDAKDITSETFIRLWTAKEVRIETVKGYLLTIARNLFLQAQRNRKLEVELDENLADATPRADAVMESRSELHAVLAALQSLPEVDRTALILRANENLPHREIAEILSLSVSAVKVKVHRARLKLASQLAEET